MAALKPFPITGFATIEGKRLNDMVTVLNNATGQGTPGALTGTTISATGLLTSTGGQTFGGVEKNNFIVVIATGTSLGTARLIPSTAAVVIVDCTASTEGVKLPTAATGLTITLFANGARGCKVYARATGQKIGANTTATTAFAVTKTTGTIFFARNTTTWYVSGA